MSLTVQQLLSDAKRLSSRLRDHDQSADHLISRAQEVLKEVDAMRQYQEDVENLNEVAHNRPRAQLVLGIQQENRHIRTLQQENKELRAALEEHQNALELIMSKYRQHVTRLVNTPHPDIHTINNQKIQMLAERTEKVCEMAAVMKEAVRVDEEACNQQQELMARLITENKGLRELLEISQKNSSSPKMKKVVTNVNKEVQTDTVPTVVEQEVSVTLPMPAQPKPPPRSPKVLKERKVNVEQSEHIDQSDILECGVGELSSGDSDETGSEDESVKYDTIKLADRRNKETLKIKADEASEATEPVTLSPAQTELKSETPEEKDDKVNPSNDTQSIVNNETVLSGDEQNHIKKEAEEDIKSLSCPPASAMAKDEQNLVIVDSLVDQLVQDSVETSTVSSTAAPTDKSELNIATDISSDSKEAETESDTKALETKASPAKQTPDVQEQTNTPTSSSSSQQASKNPKTEPGHSRSNSKNKGKKNTENKGNKNSPKKGNKK